MVFNMVQVPKKLYLTMIPDTASEEDVAKIFKKTLKDFKVILKPGKKVEGIQYGFLSWNDDVDGDTIIQKFKGTKIGERYLDLKPHHDNKTQESSRNSTTTPKPSARVRQRKLSTGARESCIVTNYKGKTSFHVQLGSEAGKLQKMNAELLENIDQSKVIHTQTDAFISFIYAGLYEDNQWHRVKVLQHLDNNMVEVEFIDFGNRGVLSYTALRILPTSVALLPPFAYSCTLSNVEVIIHKESLFIQAFENSVLYKPSEIIIEDIIEPPNPKESATYNVDLFINGRRFIEDMVTKKFLRFLTLSQPASLNRKQSPGTETSFPNSPTVSGRGSPYTTSGSTSIANYGTAVASDEENSESQSPGGPVLVKILRFNPEEMEVAVRLLEKDHVRKWQVMRDALQTLRSKITLTELQVGATVDTHCLYLCTSREDKTLYRCRIVRRHNTMMSSSVLLSVFTVSLIDVGLIEEKPAENGVVPELYIMPSESLLNKHLSVKATTVLLRCPRLGRVFPLKWHLFDLQVAPGKKQALVEEVDRLKRATVQAKFDPEENWTDFRVDTDGEFVPWKDQLIPKGILILSSGELLSYPAFTEDHVENPELTSQAAEIKELGVQKMEGFVTFVSENAEIYVCLREDIEQVNRVREWSDRPGTTSRGSVKSGDILPGQVYGVLHSGLKMRFMVQGVDNMSGHVLCRGQLMDFGSPLTVATSQLFTLPEDVAAMKPLVVKFVLDDRHLRRISDGTKFKAAVDAIFHNCNVTVLCLNLSPTEQGVPFINMYSQSADMFSVVRELVQILPSLPEVRTALEPPNGGDSSSIQANHVPINEIEGNMRLVIKESLLYRSLLTTQFIDTLQSLVNNMSASLMDAQHEWQDISLLSKEFDQIRHQLEDNIRINPTLTMAEIQPLVEERQRLAESIVSKSSTTTPVSGGDTKQELETYLHNLENTVSLLKRMTELFHNESRTSLEDLKDVGSEGKFNLMELKEALDTILTEEVREELERAWKVSDTARATFDESTKKWIKTMSTFSQLQEKPFQVLQFDEQLTASDMHLSMYLKHWDSCLMEEMLVCKSKVAGHEIHLQQTLIHTIQLLQHHIDHLRDCEREATRFTHISTEAGNLIQLVAEQEPQAQVFDRFASVKKRLKKAVVTLLRVYAQLKELELTDSEDDDVDKSIDVDKERLAAIAQIHKIWLEEAHLLDLLTRQSEVCPELSVCYRGRVPERKQGVINSWDDSLIERTETSLGNGYFKATFADKEVLMRDMKVPEVALSVKSWLLAYRDAWNTHKQRLDEETQPILLELVAVFEAGGSLTAPSSSQTTTSSSSTVTAIIEGVGNGALPLFLEDSSAEVSRSVAQMSEAEQADILEGAVRVLTILFSHANLVRELPRCWLLPLEKGRWTLRMEPPFLEVQVPGDILDAADAVASALNTLVKQLGLENLAWVHEWSHSREF